MDDGPSWLLTATTVGFDLGLAAMVGSVASTVWLRGMRSDWGCAFAQRARWTLFAAAVFSALAFIALLCVQTAAMADVPLREIGASLWPVLGSTQVGHAWLAAAPCLLAALIAAGVGMRRQGAPMIWLASLATLAVICCRAAASHAAAQGPVSIAVGVEALHLLLISLWIGMVLVAAVAFDAASIGCDAAARADAAGWIRQLSGTATLVLAAIVLTGVFNAWREMGAVSDLTTTSWGRSLVLKLAFVCAAVLLGGLNRTVTLPALLPALERVDTPLDLPLGRFLLVVRIEACLLIAALVVAAVLAASAPAAAVAG